MPSITVDKFYAGICEDDKYGVDGSFIHSENLRIGKDGSFVELSGKPMNRLQITSGKSPYGIYEVNGYMLVFCEDGEIYKLDNNTPVYTHSGGRDIVAMFQNADDVIFVTYHGGGNHMQFHKISKNSISSNNWTGLVTENFISIPVPAGDVYTPAIRDIGNKCYLGIGNKVVKLNYNPNALVYTFDIYNFPNKPIRGITYSGAVIKCFQSDGIMYIWDGVAENQSETINLDVPIRAVLSLANIDYIVGGISQFYTEFFYLNGYTAVPIFQKKYSYKMGAEKNNIINQGAIQNYLTYKNGSLYFGGRYNNKSGIVKFGEEINGLGKAVSVLNTVSSFGRNYSNIYAVYGREAGLYVAYYDGLNYGVDFIDISNQFPNEIQKLGSLTTKKYDFGSLIEEKQIKEISVRAYQVNSLQKIVLKYSADKDGYSFYTIGEITSNGVSTFQLPSGNYENGLRDITLRFDFDMSAYPISTNDGPKFYGFKIDYDINKQ